MSYGIGRPIERSVRKLAAPAINGESLGIPLNRRFKSIRDGLFNFLSFVGSE